MLLKKRRKRALIVIDEAVTLGGIVNILNIDGYYAKGISSDNRVLEIASYFQPDIILMNVSLDLTDGYYLCKEIKRKDQTKDTPIVLMTQQTDQDYQPDKLYEPDAMMEIPFNLHSLLSNIEDHIAA